MYQVGVVLILTMPVGINLDLHSGLVVNCDKFIWSKDSQQTLLQCIHIDLMWQGNGAACAIRQHLQMLTCKKSFAKIQAIFTGIITCPITIIIVFIVFGCAKLPMDGGGAAIVVSVLVSGIQNTFRFVSLEISYIGYTSVTSIQYIMNLIENYNKMMRCIGLMQNEKMKESKREKEGGSEKGDGGGHQPLFQSVSGIGVAVLYTCRRCPMANQLFHIL